MQGEIVLPIRQHKDEILVTIILLVAAFFCLGIPTIAIAALCTKYLQSYRTRREYIIFSIASLLGFGFGTLQLEKITAAIGGEVTYLASLISVIFDPSHQRNISGTPFLTLSFATLPLSPVIGGAMDIFNRLGQAFKTGETLDEKLARAQKLEEERNLRLQQIARQKAIKGTSGGHDGELVIGTMLRGDSLPMGKDDSIGIKQRGEWIVFDDEILDEHHFVLGSTGAGKTTALLRLVEQVLKDKQNNRRLIIVDGKGEEKLAQAIRALVWKHRGHDTPIFRFGGRRTGAHFDGFSGSAVAIVNRLSVMVGVQEAQGNGTWFADVNKFLLQCICYSPKGPPRSFAELNKRLSMNWLVEAYKHDRGALNELQAVPDEGLPNLAIRLRSFMKDFGHIVNDKGFNLEEVDTAVFSIKAISVSDAAKRLGYFIVETMNDMVSNWEGREERGLFLIDEFGVFGISNISALLSQARSSGWGVGLYTQSYAQLGDDLTAEEILSNCTTKFLMGTDYPEKLGSTVGTHFQMEHSIQSNDQGPTGMMSGRVQHAFKVDMNTVRRFKKGQSFVLRHGYAIAIQVSMAELTPKEVAANPPEEGWGIGTEPAAPTQVTPIPTVEATEVQEAQLEREETPPTEESNSPVKKARRGRGAATL